MATRQTQQRIIESAMMLFNDHGARSISVNRVAEHAGLSRGLLHYHFKTKEALIGAIFEQLAAESPALGLTADGPATQKRLRRLFEAYMRVVWRYRFFFRELTALLQRDELLRARYREYREQRLTALIVLFEALVAAGEMRRPPPPVTLESLVTASWVICDGWFVFLEAGNSRPAEADADDRLEAAWIETGYRLVAVLLEPYLASPGEKKGGAWPPSKMRR